MKKIALLCLGALTLSAGPDDFYRAIRTDDLAALKRLVAAEGVDTKDARGTTPLMFASAAGSIDAMKLLLAAGADVNAVDAMGTTALLWAAPQQARVRLLLDRGAKADVAAKSGMTPLMVAAAVPGNLEAVKLLIGAGADVRKKNAMGTTALHAAAMTGSADTVRELLSQGAEADLAGMGGATPLVMAAINRDESVVLALLDSGQKINANTRFTFADKVRHGEIALKDMAPLMLSAPFHSTKVTGRLLDMGATVDAQDSRGMTALMMAVATEYPRLDTIKLLVSRGANPNLKSAAGESAVDWARKFGNPEVLRLLGAEAPKPKVHELRARQIVPQDAISRSVALLQEKNTEFFKQAGCVSCHSGNFASLAVGAAKRNGHSVDVNAAEENVKRTRALWVRAQGGLFTLMSPPGDIDTVMHAANAMAADEAPQDGVTDGLAVFVASRQRPDGSWSFGFAPRAPISDGDIRRTVMAMITLKTYGTPARKAEFDERLARAAAFLAKARPVSTDDYAMQLLGLKLAGGYTAELKESAKQLLKLQRPDGGWGSNRHLASNAYATGQAMYALLQSGMVERSSVPVKRASSFLINSQHEDGSWHVASRAPKFQPYFESGFPYGHDQWISATGTAWAVMGLSEAHPRNTVAVAAGR